MTALSLRERAISGYKVIKRIADFLLERTKFAIKEWIVSLFLRFYKNKFFSVAPRHHRQKRAVMSSSRTDGPEATQEQHCGFVPVPDFAGFLVRNRTFSHLKVVSSKLLPNFASDVAPSFIQMTGVLRCILIVNSNHLLA